jgi:hypothetical protein
MAQIRFTTFPPKDPDEKKDYSFDWSAELDKTADTISSSTWVVTGTGLTQSSSPAPSFDHRTATVWYEAGTIGTDYVITNRIVTAQGRTHEASAILPCRDAGA